MNTQAIIEIVKKASNLSTDFIRTVLWGASETGRAIYHELERHHVNLDAVIDGYKEGFMGKLRIRKPEEINFEDIDLAILGISGSTYDLQSELKSKYPWVKILALNHDKKHLVKRCNYTLSKSQKKQLTRYFYPKRQAKLLIRKTFSVNPVTVDLDKCLKAIRSADYEQFSYGEKYNAILYDMINSIFRKCDKKKSADIGCESGLYPAMHVACGFNCTVFDIKKLEIHHPRVDFVKGDLTKDNTSQKYLSRFDMVTCISTAEHVGLGRYGDPIDPEGDRKLVKGIRRILKNKGYFILSVPVGPGCVVYNLHRIYSEYRLKWLLRGFEIVNIIIDPSKEKNRKMGDDSYQPIYLMRKVN